MICLDKKQKTKKKKLLLRFPKQAVNEPVVYLLIKDFNLVVNIFKAKVNPNEEGELGIEVEGDSADFDNAIDFLKKKNISCEPLSKEIFLDDSSCTHCSACTSVCPTGALSLDRKTRKVNFVKEKCIACELCVNACPFKAISVRV